jgi:hypothetical protein
MKIRLLVALVMVAIMPTMSDARCTRLPEHLSTAFNPEAKKITLPWRTDLPQKLATETHAWDGIDFRKDWRGYIAAVLSEVKASGLRIADKSIIMSANASWWIAPWMDFGGNGREPLLGLTKERGPDPDDLAPGSAGGRQVWAIGWYNTEGAFAVGQVFADPCNPKIPATPKGQRWTFPNNTASFKLLFTDAPATEVRYLEGAPVVEAMIDPPPKGKGGRQKRELRLLQVDIMVRDPGAADTAWVMGTFIWKGPAKGDGFFDNLVPVGLMWGNDPKARNAVWAAQAQIEESRLNPDLAGVVWQGPDGKWPQRPYPGFQGRLNGPADNLRSSCLSCHALSQWRLDPNLIVAPRYPIALPKPPLDADGIADVVAKYFKNVPGGRLTDETLPATPLDYSMQLQAGISRMCTACSRSAMTGATPDMCKAPGSGQITRPNCERGLIDRFMALFRAAEAEVGEMLTRQ